MVCSVVTGGAVSIGAKAEAGVGVAGAVGVAGVATYAGALAGGVEATAGGGFVLMAVGRTLGSLPNAGVVKSFVCAVAFEAESPLPSLLQPMMRKPAMAST